MAQKSVTVLACDRCGRGGEDVQTHTLSLDGRAVVFEACEREWARVEKALAPWLTSARRVPRKAAAKR